MQPWKKVASNHGSQTLFQKERSFANWTSFQRIGENYGKEQFWLGLDRLKFLKNMYRTVHNLRTRWNAWEKNDIAGPKKP